MSPSLPQQVDVAIIGGGIIGISTAWALAKAGLKVAVFEKGVVAGEQSSRNWGWIRSIGRDPAELPLAHRANSLWREIQRQVNVGYRQTGLAYLGENAADQVELQKWLDSARLHPTGARLLTGDAVRKLLAEPSQRPWTSALHSGEDGVAEPHLATAGIAQLAQAAGCQIFEQCAVRGLDIVDGRTAGVITEHGRVGADRVVLAGGAWSRLMCGNTGVFLPQLKVHGSALRTAALPNDLDLAINGKQFTCRPRADGGYTVSRLAASVADVTPDSIRLMRLFLPAWMAQRQNLKIRFGRRFFEELLTPTRFALDRPTPFEKTRILDPGPNVGAVHAALRQLQQAFPAFEGAQVAHAWGGMMDVTPDALPVISAVDAIPGFFIGTGFSGHGFGIGPAAGELLAELVREVVPTVGHHAFRLSRFRASRRDGSPHAGSRRAGTQGAE
ncbi:FAD-dependent oxidoreductase [Variovorax sp. J31P207]|uniref:NAD(P)/FAD-dependent oxidoreductase n=1 Tax=Variovorax sp. J31P207 TaxID=3053510 RepID=UPI0025757347|nr:FAD-dependent oxidoreductase [Variovorax sp. J31P207]MDM0071231.1 FAD-dependent oxidoreductase [Variovorax sp. J31P207]